MAARQEQCYIQINPREAWQTPAFRRPEQSFDDARLFPPARQILDSTLNVLDEIQSHPRYYVELPTPASSPSAALFDQQILAYAASLGIVSRVPMHVRMTHTDMGIAMAVGGKAIHGMGNPPGKDGEKGRSVHRLLQTLDTIEPVLVENDVAHFRASLEHALHTPEEDILQFIHGLRERNQRARHRYGRDVYTAIGLPDTNGDGTPEQFIRLLQLIEEHGGLDGMKIFAHLHKDNGLAIANAQAILDAGERLGSPVVLEVAPDVRFPGERVGILDPDDLGSITELQDFPLSASTLMKGSSWKDGLGIYSDADMRSIAVNTNVAGIHTGNRTRYGNGNGWSAPGLYSVMGKANIADIQELVLQSSPASDEVLAASSLIGRELSAQDGHLPHGVAIRLAQLAAEDPGFVIHTAHSFGDPLAWTSNPLPDLNHVRVRLELPLQFGQLQERRLGLYD